MMLEPVLPHSSLHWNLSICQHIHACLSMVALKTPVNLCTDMGQCLQATGMYFMYSCTIDHNTLAHMGRTAELQLLCAYSCLMPLCTYSATCPHNTHIHMTFCKFTHASMHVKTSLHRYGTVSTSLYFMYTCTVDHNTLAHMGRTAELYTYNYCV